MTMSFPLQAPGPRQVGDGRGEKVLVGYDLRVSTLGGTGL